MQRHLAYPDTGRRQHVPGRDRPLGRQRRPAQSECRCPRESPRYPLGDRADREPRRDDDLSASPAARFRATGSRGRIPSDKPVCFERPFQRSLSADRQSDVTVVTVARATRRFPMPAVRALVTSRGPASAATAAAISAARTASNGRSSSATTDCRQPRRSKEAQGRERETLRVPVHENMDQHRRGDARQRDEGERIQPDHRVTCSSSPAGAGATRALRWRVSDHERVVKALARRPSAPALEERGHRIRVVASRRDRR